MRATSPSSANRLPRSVDHQPLALPPPSSSTAADGGPLLNHSTSVQTGGRSGEHRSVKDDDDALLLDGGWDDVREALLVAESDRDTTVTSLRHALPLPEPGSSSSLAVTNATGGTTGTTESFDDSLQAVPQLSAAFPAAVSVPVSAFSFDPWSDRQPSAFASTFVASLDSSSRHVGASTYTSHAGDEGASVAQRYHLGDTFTGTHYDLGQHAAAVQIPQQYASVPSSSFGLPLQQQQQHSQQRQHWLGSAPAHVLDRAVGGGGPAAHHANTPVSSQPFDYRDGHGPPVPLHQHLAPYSPSEPSYDRNTGGLDRRLPQRAGSTTDHQRHSYQRPPSGALAFAPKPPNAASRRPAQPPTPAAPLHVRRLAADRTASAKPGLAAGPSPPSSSSARPPAGLKLRSGLPERTSYAMWIGNVPADATEAELWAFFLKLPPLVPSQGGGNGLQSVHLIARSQCAFLNLDTEAHLLHTIAHSHGLLLRPHDPKCKPFVCRLRRVEDDAKSGVGAQRGGGLHRAWVAETKERLLLSPQKQQSRQQSQPPRFDSHDGVDDESGRRSVDSTSTNSTDSEFFKEHFPKRYFILKAHNRFDLEQSVKHSYWSTQPHNEAVLDQAFRTASEGVILFFSANKSGEWAGFARMTGTMFAQPDVRAPITSSSMSTLSLSSLDSLHAAAAQQVSPAPRRPFRVHWLSSQPVPFLRTRHILNSFNANREVKICRDGTEVEPFAGEELVKELQRGTHTHGQPSYIHNASHNMRGSAHQSLRSPAGPTASAGPRYAQHPHVNAHAHSHAHAQARQHGPY